MTKEMHKLCVFFFFVLFCFFFGPFLYVFIDFELRMAKAENPDSETTQIVQPCFLNPLTRNDATFMVFWQLIQKVRFSLARFISTRCRLGVGYSGVPSELIRGLNCSINGCCFELIRKRHLVRLDLWLPSGEDNG